MKPAQRALAGMTMTTDAVWDDASNINCHRETATVQTLAPNKAPTPAVNAMASAPQNVTRMVDFHIGDPPA